jgi:1,4-alpha-glucan branching enzyme
MYYNMRDTDSNPIIDRGIALHKLIRLMSISLGGQAYLNFMGNEFGHPEWIDFPREGNNWSYHYARRQWSLVDNNNLKYKYLASFDKEMLHVISEHKVMVSEYARQLNVDEANKCLVFERGKLIFVFNFHPERSIFDYHFNVPETGEYKIILNSDSTEFGGFGRIDDEIVYPAFFSQDQNQVFIRLYLTNRTALVLKKI